MNILKLSARAWLRHVVPLTLLSALALSPLAIVALRLPVAGDADGVRSQIWLAWIVAGAAWACQLVLVAAVAPAVRAAATGAALGQRRALVDGARSLARGLVPCAIAVAAVALGLAALVVPGLVLLVLVATTGASERLGEPPPAALVDAAAAARARRRAAAIVVAAMLVVSAAIVVIVQWRLNLFGELPKKPPRATLASARTLVRTLAIALVAASPPLACALAATYVDARSQRSS